MSRKENYNQPQPQREKSGERYENDFYNTVSDDCSELDLYYQNLQGSLPTHVHSGGTSVVEQEYVWEQLWQGYRETSTESRQMRRYKESMRIVDRLFVKYASSQNYYYTRDVNEILTSSRSPTVISYKDRQVFDEEVDYMKRFYQRAEYPKKISLLTEYYKFHRDIPRLFMLPETYMVNYFYEKKRKLDYFRIAMIIEHENQLNPQRPPKGIVGEKPLLKTDQSEGGGGGGDEADDDEKRDTRKGECMLLEISSFINRGNRVEGYEDDEEDFRCFEMPITRVANAKTSLKRRECKDQQQLQQSMTLQELNWKLEEIICGQSGVLSSRPESETTIPAVGAASQRGFDAADFEMFLNFLHINDREKQSTGAAATPAAAGGSFFSHLKQVVTTKKEGGGYIKQMTGGGSSAVSFQPMIIGDKRREGKQLYRESPGKVTNKKSEASFKETSAASFGPRRKGIPLHLRLDDLEEKPVQEEYFADIFAQSHGQQQQQMNAPLSAKSTSSMPTGKLRNPSSPQEYGFIKVVSLRTDTSGTSTAAIVGSMRRDEGRREAINNNGSLQFKQKYSQGQTAAPQSVKGEAGAAKEETKPQLITPRQQLQQLQLQQQQQQLLRQPGQLSQLHQNIATASSFSSHTTSKVAYGQSASSIRQVQTGVVIGSSGIATTPLSPRDSLNTAPFNTNESGLQEEQLSKKSSLHSKKGGSNNTASPPIVPSDKGIATATSSGFVSTHQAATTLSGSSKFLAQSRQLGLRLRLEQLNNSKDRVVHTSGSKERVTQHGNTSSGGSIIGCISQKDQLSQRSCSGKVGGEIATPKYNFFTVFKQEVALMKGNSNCLLPPTAANLSSAVPIQLSSFGKMMKQSPRNEDFNKMIINAGTIQQNQSPPYFLREDLGEKEAAAASKTAKKGKHQSEVTVQSNVGLLSGMMMHSAGSATAITAQFSAKPTAGGAQISSPMIGVNTLSHLSPSLIKSQITAAQSIYRKGATGNFFSPPHQQLQLQQVVVGEQRKKGALSIQNQQRASRSETHTRKNSKCIGTGQSGSQTSVMTASIVEVTKQQQQQQQQSQQQQQQQQQTQQKHQQQTQFQQQQQVQHQQQQQQQQQMQQHQQQQPKQPQHVFNSSTSKLVSRNSSLDLASIANANIAGMINQFSSQIKEGKVAAGANQTPKEGKPLMVFNNNLQQQQPPPPQVGQIDIHKVSQTQFQQSQSTNIPSSSYRQQKKPEPSSNSSSSSASASLSSQLRVAVQPSKQNQSQQAVKTTSKSQLDGEKIVEDQPQSQQLDHPPQTILHNVLGQSQLLFQTGGVKQSVNLHKHTRSENIRGTLAFDKDAIAVLAATAAASPYGTIVSNKSYQTTTASSHHINTPSLISTALFNTNAFGQSLLASPAITQETQSSSGTSGGQLRSQQLSEKALQQLGQPISPRILGGSLLVKTQMRSPSINLNAACNNSGSMNYNSSNTLSGNSQNTGQTNTSSANNTNHQLLQQMPTYSSNGSQYTNCGSTSQQQNNSGTTITASAYLSSPTPTKKPVSNSISGFFQPPQPSRLQGLQQQLTRPIEGNYTASNRLTSDYPSLQLASQSLAAQSNRQNKKKSMF